MQAEPQLQPTEDWVMRPLRPSVLQWDRLCPYCGIAILTNERPGFCCGPGGSKLGDIVPLPPLPFEYEVFIHHPDISRHSRILNLLFSFAALETDADFPQFNGPPSFLAIQGRVYHRIRPTHSNSGARWALYDGYMREFAPFQNWLQLLPPEWTNALTTALIRVNPLTQQLRFLSQFPPTIVPNAHIIIRDSGSVNEIAALFRYDNTAAAEISPREIVISWRAGQTSNIPTVSRLWEPLAYPLFFPQGTLGWGITGSGRVDSRIELLELGELRDDEDVPTTQIWHYRARLLRDERFRIFGRLTNEYVVDMWTRELDCRLQYIRKNQEQRRLEDAQLMGEGSVPNSENIYLPASFLGSRAWASEQVADALAIAGLYGVPTLFITFTCNPEWNEIQSQLRPGQTYADAPVVVCRVFRQKLAALIQTLRTLFTKSKHRYTIYTIEFQKRGLPHAHILIKYDRDLLQPWDIDQIISAEIPNNEHDANLVRRFMIHSHPSPNRPASRYCQRENEDGTRTCRFKYPQNLQETTTIDVEGRVHYRRRHQGDEWVVPHCLPLLRMFRCHINVEVANTSHIFQYLFKYIHKGPDRALFAFTDGSENPIDEINDFWAGRYLSATEATWRILGYHITRKEPSVTTLPVHLDIGTHHHQYHRRDGRQSNLSLLNRYFCRPVGFFSLNGNQTSFDNLSYIQYYTLFRLAKWEHRLATRPDVFNEHNIPPGQTEQLVIKRKPNRPHLARIEFMKPSHGERFYLRALLLSRCPRSFNDLKTINGVQYRTFQDAATALGLFADQREAEWCLAEAVACLSTPTQLRFLFLDLLINDRCTFPRQLWDTFCNQLSYDYFLQSDGNPQLGYDLTLQELSHRLEEHGKSLADYGLPQPIARPREVLYELRRWNGNPEFLAERAAAARNSLNNEQLLIYDLVIQAVSTRTPLLLFVDGKAGRGKTYLVNCICDEVRSRGLIVIPTATSAFAAQLYPGGRTAHSAFGIPVNEFNEMLISSITPTSSRGELLRETPLFIWDELPMANKAAVTCFEELCRSLMQNNQPFGGKIVILLGDFRQTCPVIRKGGRLQVVDASFRSSPLWPRFQVHRLIQPVRNAADPEFAAFVDTIGDGAGPIVQLPFIGQVARAEDLIDFVFPLHILQSPAECLTRAILAPTNRQVDAYNASIIAKIEGPQRLYLAADSLQEATDAGLENERAVLDFVAQQPPPGLPAHALNIKVGAVYRLLRNFSTSRGLVKNIRVVVTNTGNRIITVRLLRGIGGGNEIMAEDILIPRIDFTSQLESGHTLKRTQFPLGPAYATTFNSCQGLTLDRIGIDLTRPVFSHGQLYTALSRIRHRDHARVRFQPGEMTTENIVYPEILI